MNTIFYPKSIVVVGEGPAGLATAIVARLQNHEVVLIKRRENYRREQIVFLKMSALNFLKKINVLRFLKMEMVQLNATTQALIKISHLEKVLYSVAQKLGVKVMQGQFEKIESHSAVLTDKRKVPYHILVGADGARSKVREAVNIKCHQVGLKTKAASVFVPKKVEKAQVHEVSADHFFLRKVDVPSGTFLLLHVKAPQTLPHANKQTLMSAASSCGWEATALQMVKKKRGCVLSEDVEVNLQQATHFCDSSQDVILVGDATTTGSFYLGRGVNLAFETVEVAQVFFALRKDATAYEWYNQRVKKLSDELITSNLPLFSRL